MIPFLKGRLSYTAPKLPEIRRKMLTFNNIIKSSKQAKIAVVLDWLSIYFAMPEGSIILPENDNDSYSFETNSLTFESETKGTTHFRFRWKILKGAEQLGTLLTHSRNEKFFKKEIVKLDFANHLFYSNQLWPFYGTVVTEMHLKFKSVGRVDIAIDGVNYLIEFFNEYLKQDQSKKVIELLGRPRFNANVYDRQLGRFENFKFGKLNSGKEVTIYNKSLDIVNKRKDYIQKWWKANGITEKILPIDELHDPNYKKSERIRIPGYHNLYRFEIRLTGETLAEIKDFSLELLQTNTGIMSILKLVTRSYFEPIWLEDDKTSRCTKIELLPFDRFTIIPLQKVELKQRGDLYKAKLSINKNIKQLYTGAINPDNASVFEMITFDVKTYDLEQWLHNKLDNEWMKKYSALNRDKTYTKQIDEFLEELKNFLPIPEDN